MNDHLRLISIFHYVVGGLHCLCFSFPLLHFFIGLGLVTNVIPASTHDPNEAVAAKFMGAFFMVMGGVFVLAGWTLGILTMMSGKRISERRSRTFSIVMAGINCAFMPFGTILGIFTIVLLTKPEAIAQYERSGLTPS
jgi:hypothetical protein